MPSPPPRFCGRIPENDWNVIRLAALTECDTESEWYRMTLIREAERVQSREFPDLSPAQIKREVEKRKRQRFVRRK